MCYTVHGILHACAGASPWADSIASRIPPDRSSLVGCRSLLRLGGSGGCSARCYIVWAIRKHSSQSLESPGSPSSWEIPPWWSDSLSSCMVLGPPVYSTIGVTRTGGHADKQPQDGNRAATKSNRSGVICCCRVWFWSPPVDQQIEGF